MKKIIVEVGSTVTKVDLYNGESLEKLKNITIWFKKNYAEENKLKESDVNLLIEETNKLKSITSDIYVCGTSIFRDLNDEERGTFLSDFKNRTGYEFHIISSEDENVLTVEGATRFVKDKVCVCIPGGGSTEMAIYENGILESVNSKIGVVDVMNEYPDLSNDLATSTVNEVKEYVKRRLTMPTTKADVLILAGGAHLYFAKEANLKYEENSIYNDINAPIMMDIKTRISETERYFKEMSLDEIRSRVEDPKWWFATRAMCALVLAVAESIDAKYIIPTDIAMSYGIINRNN